MQASESQAKETPSSSRLILDLLGTTEKTSSSGGDETSLLTLGGVSGDSGSLSDMLVVTTTVRMVDWVHGNTTSLWPAVALDGELVLSTGSLQERLVGTTTTSDDTDHSTGVALDDLLGTGWELDTGLALIWVVTDNGNVVSGGTTESTTVTDLLLDVGDDGTFWDGSERKDVSDGQGSVLTGVDELAGVHALVGDEGLGVELELVWVTEDNLGQWGTTSWVVDDVLYDTTNVTVSLSIVEGTELSWGLVQTGVGSEDRATALSLVTNNSSHFSKGLKRGS